MPARWNKGGWGSNTATISYPVGGVSGSKAAKVAITSYSSGDAKWFFDDVPVSQATYTYGTNYLSNISSTLTARFKKSDGTYTYVNIGTAPAVGTFSSVSVDFSVPAGVSSLTVFHLINKVGELTIDNVTLVKKDTSTEPPPGIFNTGAVSFTFDDSWLSQYVNAVPVLKNAGLKATFYITTKQISDLGYSSFMSTAQIKDTYAQGFEISAHTRTHPSLPSLSDAKQRDEIAGSRQDLIAMSVGPVQSFAYPFGEYDAQTITLVKEAGFSSARATIPGTVLRTSDHFQLAHFSMKNSTALDQVKQAIDAAAAHKEWLIFTFHQIDTSGSLYSTSPVLLQQIIEYVKLKGMPVVTVSDGVSAMQ